MIICIIYEYLCSFTFLWIWFKNSNILLATDCYKENYIFVHVTCILCIFVTLNFSEKAAIY